MSSRFLVDDHLLLRTLLDDEPEELRPDGGEIWTTGLWYHRLCRAVGASAVAGALSRKLGQAEPQVGAAAAAAITTLPGTVGLISFRDLAWPMADLLRTGERLNLLSLEALAAAEHLDATICLATEDDNPPLLAAAASRCATRLL